MEATEANRESITKPAVAITLQNGFLSNLDGTIRNITGLPALHTGFYATAQEVDKHIIPADNHPSLERERLL